MHVRIQTAILVTSALVALASWQLLLRVHPMIAVPDELFGLTQPNTEQIALLREHSRLNISYVLAIYGALATLAGIPVIACQSRSNHAGYRPLLTRLLGFVVLAILAGGVGGSAFQLDRALLRRLAADYLRSLGACLDSIVGIAPPVTLVASLLAALFTKDLKQFPGALVGGLIGAVLASVAYALIAGLVFQNENSDAVLPPGASCQLLLFFLIPWLVWATIVYQLKGSSSLACRPAEHALEPV